MAAEHTARVYDLHLDAWQIIWIDPGHQFIARQIGRARGPDIVQEGKDEGGVLRRWSFTEITQHSFHWTGETSPDSGASWVRQVDVFARIRAAPFAWSPRGPRGDQRLARACSLGRAR